MISRSLVCVLFILSEVTSFVVHPNPARLQLKKQRQRNNNNDDDDDNVGSAVVMKIVKDRRKFLMDTTTTATSVVACSVVLSSVLPLNAMAVENNNLSLETYQDDDCGFKVSVPSNWEKSVQSLRDRRKIVFFTDPSSSSSSDQEKNLFFIAYTPVRDDFTSLSSFGSVEQVRTYIYTYIYFYHAVIQRKYY